MPIISERQKILDRAKKLKELADRGIGGEKVNAEKMLIIYKEKHKISDNELNAHKLDKEVFKGYTMQQMYSMMAEELKMEGYYLMAAGVVGLLENLLQVQDLKTKYAERNAIRWEYNPDAYSYKGFVGSDYLFDIQQTRTGAILYKSGRKQLKKELAFNNVEEAQEYCERIKLDVIQSYD